LGGSKGSTYNIFEMKKDFIDMLGECHEIIPSNKDEIIARIKELNEAEATRGVGDIQKKL